MKIETDQPMALDNRGRIKSLNEPQSLEAQKARLKKTTKEFESYFILHMLKAMRQTIPKSGFLDGGLGNDIYESLFDQELSKEMAGKSHGSISDMLYRSLARTLEAEEPGKPKDPGFKSLDNTSPINTELKPVNRSYEKPVNIPPAGDKGSGTSLEVKEVPEPQTFKVSQPQFATDPVLKRYGDVIQEAAERYDVDSRLIYSVIMAESGGRADAVSSKGAKGLMQLMDATAREMEVSDSLNPTQNIMGGARYLKTLLKKYNGDLTKTVAAYNAGPSRVDRFGGIPPYSETRRYVQKVLGGLNTLKTVSE